MSRFPQSFYALGRRWARPDASRANWGLPPFEEAARLAREADMPWLSEEARAEFAKHPESLGHLASADKDGDVQQAPLVSGAVPKGDAPCR